MRFQGYVLNSQSTRAAVALSHKRTYSVGISTGLWRHSLNRRQRQAPHRAFALKSENQENTMQDTSNSVESFPAPWLSGEGGNVADLILTNYQRIFDRPLVDEKDSSRARELLWNLEAIILAHNIFVHDPPQYVYGNKIGLETFEASWDEFVAIESTLTTDSSAAAQNTRNTLLERAGENGYSDVSGAIRISLKGRLICLRKGKLFTMEDKSGKKRGQGVCIEEWEFLDEE